MGSDRSSSSSVATRRKPLGRRLLQWALFLGLQALLVLVGLEILGRVADPLGISYYPETAKFFDTVIREEPIGYRAEPGLSRRFWGHTVSFNQLGMRDREVAGEKAADEFRLMVLGDSWPFGLGLGDDETIPQLEDQLNAERPRGPRVRTLNMGLPSYNTEQERIVLEQRGFDLDPDAVMLVFVPNDIEPKTWVLDKRRGFLVDAAQRSYATSLLVVLSRLARKALGSERSMISVGAFQRDHPRWQAVETNLLRVAEWCRERGIPFVLFATLPQDDPPLLLLQQVAAEHDLDFVNLRWQEDPRWAERDRTELQNSVVDSHPNREGAAAYATLIREGLERLMIVPRALATQTAAPADKQP